MANPLKTHIFVASLLLLATVAPVVSSSSEVRKGDLVCSPQDFVCGIVISCNGDMCKILGTHSIDRNVPVRYKPQFVTQITIKKDGLYISERSGKSLWAKVNANLKDQSEPFKKWQKICFSVKYTNAPGQITRCGKILSCNKRLCRVGISHLKVDNVNEKGAFSVLEYPLDVQSIEQVKKKDLFRNGPVVEDFVFWELLEEEFLKVLF